MESAFKEREGINELCYKKNFTIVSYINARFFDNLFRFPNYAGESGQNHVRDRSE